MLDLNQAPPSHDILFLVLAKEERAQYILITCSTWLAISSWLCQHTAATNAGYDSAHVGEVN